MKIDWTPYLGGIGIGVLSWIVFAIVDDPLGITTALSAVAGEAAVPVIGADAVAQNAHSDDVARLFRNDVAHHSDLKSPTVPG